jgi:hypothetical protein
MMGAAGTAAVDPMLLFIQALVSAIAQLDSVQKVLNGFSTMVKAAADAGLDAAMTQSLKPILQLLIDLGTPLFQILSPFLSIIGILERLNPVLFIVKVAAQGLGYLFAWLNDDVIVPGGNKIIQGVNKIIEWVNSTFNLSIATLDLLQTTTELQEEEENNAAAQQKINDAISALADYFSEKKDEIKSVYDSNISHLKDLYELGIISQEEYNSRVSELNIQYKSDISVINTEQKTQTQALQDILDQLQNGDINSTSALTLLNSTIAGFPSDLAIAINEALNGTTVNTTLTTSSATGGLRPVQSTASQGGMVKSYDVGAYEIPYDQLSIVHAGETVLTQPIASALRSGNISISGRSSENANLLGTSASTKSSSKNITISLGGVNVEGSVNDDETIDKIAQRTADRVAKGVLEIVE